MIKQTKQIIDPLETLQQDGFKKPPLNELLKINHHSPTSSSMPEGIYAFRYLFSTQEQRREFEGNATWQLVLQSMMLFNGITQLTSGPSILIKENLHHIKIQNFLKKKLLQKQWINLWSMFQSTIKTEKKKNTSRNNTSNYSTRFIFSF